MKVRVLWPLQCDGKYYGVGELLELEPKAARALPRGTVEVVAEAEKQGGKEPEKPKA